MDTYITIAPKNCETALKRLGYEKFRGPQKKVIQTVISGRDVLLLLPTGGGKSLCYQIPGLVLAGVTFVVSPLIALMENQLRSLKSKSIPASMISSTVSSLEKGEIMKDLRSSDPKTKIVYVTPETLTKEDFLKTLTDLYKREKLSLVAVDECHCISSWGHDFRPAFRKLGKIKTMFPKVPVIGLTATATAPVRQDIVTSLRLNDPKIIIGNSDRPNIHLAVFHKELLPNEDVWTHLTKLVSRSHAEDVGIVYTHTRKDAQKAAKQLKKVGILAAYYHAGLKASTRTQVLKDWEHGTLKVICGTVAFGMGIDKADVRFVIHTKLPPSLEAYYQEIGRAGRDGGKSAAVLYFSQTDESSRRYLCKLENKREKRKSKQQKKKSLDHAFSLLDKVSGYCLQNSCRRSTILSYFGNSGETYEASRPGCCDVCDAPVLVKENNAKIRSIRLNKLNNRFGGSLGTKMVTLPKMSGAPSFSGGGKGGGGGGGGGGGSKYLSKKEIREMDRYGSGGEEEQIYKGKKKQTLFTNAETRMFAKAKASKQGMNQLFDHFEGAEKKQIAYEKQKLRRKRKVIAQRSMNLAKEFPCRGTPKPLQNTKKAKPILVTTRQFCLSKIEEALDKNAKCNTSPNQSRSQKDSDSMACSIEFEFARTSNSSISYKAEVRNIISEIKKNTQNCSLFVSKTDLSLSSHPSDSSKDNSESRPSSGLRPSLSQTRHSKPISTSQSRAQCGSSLSEKPNSSTKPLAACSSNTGSKRIRLARSSSSSSDSSDSSGTSDSESSGSSDSSDSSDSSSDEKPLISRVVVKQKPGLGNSDAKKSKQMNGVTKSKALQTPMHAEKVLGHDKPKRKFENCIREDIQSQSSRAGKRAKLNGIEQKLDNVKQFMKC